MNKKRKAAPARTAKKKDRCYKYYRQNRNASIDFPQIDKIDGNSSVIPYLRVSGYYKNWRRLVKEQMQGIKEGVKGRKILKHEHDIQPGQKIKRKGLEKAYNRAKENNAIIVAIDLDRFLRHSKFHRVRNPNVKPSVQKFIEFLKNYPNVIFAVVIPVEKIKEERTKRGQKTTGNKGGGDKMRGYKKRRRENKLNSVLKLHQKGHSYQDIAIITKIPKATVGRWIKKNRIE